MPATSDIDRLHQLMHVGRRLLAELDSESVLRRILAEGRAITGARCAAIALLDPQSGEPSRVEDRADAAAGAESPGTLCELVSVLDLPIVIGDRVWARLQLSERADGGSFSEADESAAVILAEFAATAIENVRRYEQAESGRLELVRAVRGLEAARTISDAIGAEVELETILALIVKRGRALVSARSVMILLVEGDELVLAAGIGMGGDRRGTRISIAGTTSGEVLTSGVPLRLAHLPNEVRQVRVTHANGETHEVRADGETRAQLGVADMRTALMIPMIHREESIGVLIALDRGADQGTFTDSDEELMATFASSAANAVSISHSVQADRLGAAMASAEDERRRWARELHDQTLQSLGGLRVLLAGARRHDDLEVFRGAVDQAIADLEYEIQNLRGIIADLRPPLLDDLGLADALGALVDRQRDAGLAADLTLDLAALGRLGLSIPQDLETAVYRLVQEALTNVVKHAQARSVHVRVAVTGQGRLTLDVVDDGVGFDTNTPTQGFGLGSIRERVYLAGGTVSFDSGRQGTAMHAEMPLPVATPPPR